MRIHVRRVKTLFKPTISLNVLSGRNDSIKKIQNNKNWKFKVIKKNGSMFLASFSGNFNQKKSQTYKTNQRLDSWSQHCWGHCLNKKKKKMLKTTLVHAEGRCNFGFLYTVDLWRCDAFHSYNEVISVWSLWMLCRWLEAGADRPFVLGSLWSFFHFIRLFWNQILICLSERQSEWAISIRRRLVRYLLKWNSFSSSRTCCRVYAVLDRLGSDPV